MVISTHSIPYLARVRQVYPGAVVDFAAPARPDAAPVRCRASPGVSPSPAVAVGIETGAPPTRWGSRPDDKLITTGEAQKAPCPPKGRGQKDAGD